MKNIINSAFLTLSLLVMLGMASCKKNDGGGKGQPTVTRVRVLSRTDTIGGVVHRVTLDSSSTYSDIRLVAFDSTVKAGNLQNQYAIVGTNLLTTKSISFNGSSVYYNPTLVTDNTIIVTIPQGVPFGPSQSNKLNIVTKYGSVDYAFSINQPPPMITSFSPLAAGAGDTVTIVGTVFNSVIAVSFDKTPATIVGKPTPTSIQVVVPAGVVQAYIYVTTPGGTTKSAASFGFKSVLYDDALENGWGSYTGYNSTINFANTINVKRGTHSIQVVYLGSYGALQIGYGGATIDVTKQNLSALKFSLYADPATVTAGSKVQVVLNGQYGKAQLETIVPGSYVDFTIPLSTLGSPTTINELVIQAYGLNANAVIYVDDIGFI